MNSKNQSKMSGKNISNSSEIDIEQGGLISSASMAQINKIIKGSDEELILRYKRFSEELKDYKKVISEDMLKKQVQMKLDLLSMKKH